MYEKLQANRDKYTAGTENEEFSKLLKEANDILSQVKGTQEAIEDAKMFRLLCQSVREMSEDTNTNEKKFHVDEYSANLGRFINASTDGHNNPKVLSIEHYNIFKNFIMAVDCRLQEDNFCFWEKS